MCIAVVCCYRHDPLQNRERQLLEFTDTLAAVLPPSSIIIIAEQSADGRRFNRGQLLNYGAALASGAYKATSVIFHDIDLLPSTALHAEYAPSVENRVVHIAAQYERYKGPRYMGGIVRFPWELLRCINGFPNDFWGWGGEDDAMLRRCEATGILVRRAQGAVRDMETTACGHPVSLQEKLAALKASGTKCPDKWERLQKDGIAWHLNGLNEVLAGNNRPLKSYVFTRLGCKVHHCVWELSYGTK